MQTIGLSGGTGLNHRGEALGTELPAGQLQGDYVQVFCEPLKKMRLPINVGGCLDVIHGPRLETLFEDLDNAN